MEEGFKAFTNKLAKAAPLLVGILIAIWWVFNGMVEIIPTGLTVTERIGLTACTIFMAISYCKLISVGGFQAAKDSNKFVSASKDWTEAIKKGNPYKAEIIDYAVGLAKTNQKEARKNSLESVGLKYEEIFNDNGELIKKDFKQDKFHKVKNPKGLFKYQIKMIKHCLKIVIVKPEVFGSISGSKFGIKKRVSQKEFEAKKDITNTIIRIITSVFCVGMMFRWIGFSVESVIYALFQIALWTGSGVSQRLSNYNFVMNELLHQVVENTLVINGYLELKEKEKQEVKVEENTK